MNQNKEGDWEEVPDNNSFKPHPLFQARVREKKIKQQQQQQQLLHLPPRFYAQHVTGILRQGLKIPTRKHRPKMKLAIWRTRISLHSGIKLTCKACIS